MNELLAIVLIVLLCCAMFFAWLFALATCPDRLVNLISGTKSRSALSSSPMSRASEDLGPGAGNGSCRKGSGGSGGAPAGAHQLLHALVKRASPSERRDLRPLLGRSRSIPSNGVLLAGAPAAPAAMAPLSADKRANSKKLSVVPEADEQLTVTSMTQCCGASRASGGSAPRTPTSTKAPDALVVNTVTLKRHHSECCAKRLDEQKEEEEEEEEEANIEDPAEPSGQPISAEERARLYSDRPSGASYEEVDELGAVESLPACRRSAPPTIHIV